MSIGSFLNTAGQAVGSGLSFVGDAIGDFVGGVKQNFNPLQDSVASSAQSAINGDPDKDMKSLYSKLLDKEKQAAIDANDFAAQEALLNRNFQQESANAAMSFSKSEREAQQEWYERMSNTSYQRAVADMLAAGINPILAYQQGGASSAMSTAGSGSAAAGSAASAHQASYSGVPSLGKSKTVDANLLGNVISSAATVLARFVSK